MTLEEIYRLQGVEGAAGKQARVLLGQSHWFASCAEFDPKTGEALPQALSGFLTKLSQIDTSGAVRDRLWRITEHARPSVDRLLRTLNESPRREHALLPIHAVRELDANSFIKLSNRPGRNIREKLAGKPYLQAVRRYQSLNLPENRLLKAFLVRLDELLELRRDLLNEAEDDLIPRIQTWLRGDQARAIARWENLPPNNTLLAHRDYRRVWDAWRRLQTLDMDIARDLSRLDERQKTMKRWIDFGQMYRDGAHLFLEMPVTFDYEDFSIQTWLPEPLTTESVQKVPRSRGRRNITELACVDLVALHPRYATPQQNRMALADNFLWQQWSSASETVDITLFDSDAAFIHSDAVTIASPELFFGADKTSDHWDRAARAFADRLSETFKNDRLIWLVPDALNDFELQVIRRNLNARFPRAEPLPRSVAALFEQVDYNRITNDGYPVLVVDTIGGTTCATKLIARFDTNLKKCIPETNGYYWERCPPVTISERNAEELRSYEMITVGGSGEWHKSSTAERPQFIDASHLKGDPRIGSFAFCIYLSESPVAGGMRLDSLQARAGEIPLWRDQIPELAIKGYIDGFYRRFYIVSPGKTIKPIRDIGGQRIPISKWFTLPAGKRFYQFPLYQGENAAELRFAAFLESPAFPLKSNAKCELILTFKYGDDEPYNLVFNPLDSSFPQIRVTWSHTIEDIATDAPAPDYPNELSWDELRSWRDDQGNIVDLFEWLIYRFRKLRRTAKGYREQSDKENEVRTFADISRRAFVNRMGLMWADGKSLSGNHDDDFVREIKNSLQALAAMKSKSQRIEFCVWQIFSCLHKDAPRICIEWLTEQVLNGTIRDPRAVGCALGDVSQEWQQCILDRLVSHPGNDAISVFAYAIWRERHFVERFSLSELKSLLSSLSQRLANVRYEGIPKNVSGVKLPKRNWARATAEPLELLLGLLRTRSSEDPEIRTLLQPHQKITKLLAEQIDRIEEIVAVSNIALLSRVQIDLKDVQKPEGIRTPDLLYALRLYLTGDDGAKALHITGIADSDDD